MHLCGKENHRNVGQRIVFFEPSEHGLTATRLGKTLVQTPIPRYRRNPEH